MPLDHRLLAVGIRPTRQRRALLQLILAVPPRHMSAEQLYREATTSGLRLSLATVYNALNLFAQTGLLCRVDVGERTWFCSNPEDHYHLYDEGTGELTDIPACGCTLPTIPALPEDMELVRMDIIFRGRRRKR